VDREVSDETRLMVELELVLVKDSPEAGGELVENWTL